MMSDRSRDDETTVHYPSHDEVRDRLDAAEGGDDATRVDALEQLHSTLQEEIDAGEAPSTGR